MHQKREKPSRCFPTVLPAKPDGSWQSWAAWTGLSSPPASASTTHGFAPMICERLAWLGIAADPVANEAGGGRISSDASAVDVWVVPTDEEATIARHTYALTAA